LRHNVKIERPDQDVPAPPLRAENSASGRLVITAAPVASNADDSFFTHLHAEKAMANVTVSPGRAGPVEIAIQLEDADELPLSPNAVSVTLGNPEHGIEPVTADAERISADQWRVRMSVSVPGQREMLMTISGKRADKSEGAAKKVKHPTRTQPRCPPDGAAERAIPRAFGRHDRSLLGIGWSHSYCRTRRGILVCKK
jgi:hypothetical protein